jgi:hypothetical protein
MKYASAMKYGGELVAAIDCDYDSFKELIPLCPNCKEPVFLRAGGQRKSVKGKDYKVAQHWCHFDGTSKEQVAGCELRVNGYTEKDRAKIAAQARGQRLRLLQRWFWRIYSDYSVKQFEFARDNVSLINDRAKEAFVGATLLSTPDNNDLGNPILINDKEWIRDPSRAMFKDVALRMISNKEVWPFITDVEIARHVMDACAQGLTPVFFGSQSSSCLMNNADVTLWVKENQKSVADKKLHESIVLCVIDFLSSGKGVDAYAEAVAYEMYQALCATNRGLQIVGVEVVKAGTQQISGTGRLNLFKFGLVATVEMLCGIPWASEFQRLEAEAKQRNDAA